MPIAATITTYYSFTANTKARASQVNANFDLYRGHLVPIHPNTATAVNNTYDLGSSEYYWRSAYVGSLDFVTSTTTATLVLKGDTTATSGAFLFQIEGSTKAVIDHEGFHGNYTKPNSITIGGLFTRGTTLGTTTESNGGLASSSLFNVSSISVSTVGTSATYHIGGSTITLTNAARPVFVGVSGDGISVTEEFFGQTTSVGLRGIIMKDGATAASFQFNPGAYSLTNTSTHNTARRGIVFPLSCWTILFPTSGSHNYNFALHFNDSQTVATIVNARIFAYEIA